MALAFAIFLSLSAFLAPNSAISRNNTAGDFLTLAGLSLALTAINIVAIFLAALGMFRLKEVAPVVNKVAFWNEDVKLCRGLNKQQKRGVGRRLLLKKKRRQHVDNSFVAGANRESFLPLSPLPFSSAFSSSTAYDFLSPRQPDSYHRTPHHLDSASAEDYTESHNSSGEEEVSKRTMLNNDNFEPGESQNMAAAAIDNRRGLNVSVDMMADESIYRL